MAIQTITSSCRVFSGYIECKEVMCSLLRASIHVYGHQNTACRTGTLKRQHCAIPASSSVNRCTIVLVSLYTALLREAKVMVGELTGYAIGNVNTQYEWKLNILQTSPIPDLWLMMWLYVFARLTSQCVCHLQC